MRIYRLLNREVQRSALILLAMSISTLAATHEGYTSPTSTHGFSVSGELLYPPSFTQFDAASSSAPGSCDIRLATPTTFDNLNPWIIKGRRAPGVFEFLYDSLLAPSVDEFEAGYGLIATSVLVSDDNRSATFTLHADARFHDGHPITASDVVFTANTMRPVARPFWRTLLKDTIVEALSERVVRVTFQGRSKPADILSFGTLPILPEHYWSSRRFGDVVTDIPLGSGPYKISEVELGQSIKFERIDDHWAQDLPSRKGRYDFKTITYTYISENATRYLSFLRGDLDQIGVEDLRQWDSYRSYDPVKQDLVKVIEVPAWWPMGMNGFFFNMRDARFQDRRVREALASLVPFDWVNKTQLFSAYERTSSYFGNTGYEASSPPTVDEQSWMDGFRDHFPDAAFSEAWRPQDASASTKESLAHALALFEQAGWHYDESSARLVNTKDNRPLDIVILASTTTQDKIFGAWQNLLSRIGIDVTLQRIDPSSFQERYQTGDFEMTYRFYIPPLHPGAEQITQWGSQRLQDEGVQTIFGIDNAAIDDALMKLANAETGSERTEAARHLDRALQWGLYAIPTYQNRQVRTAYWVHRIAPPTVMPRVGGGTGFWTCVTADNTNE